jgi:hypothetical protein
MKAVSVILLIHIVLLSMSPQLSIPSFFNRKSVHKSCCSKEKKSREQTNDCCRYACNPFMACCNCCALINAYTGVTAPFIYSNASYNNYSENHFSGFLSKAWNPPKIG